MPMRPPGQEWERPIDCYSGHEFFSQSMVLDQVANAEPWSTTGGSACVTPSAALHHIADHLHQSRWSRINQHSGERERDVYIYICCRDKSWSTFCLCYKNWSISFFSVFCFRKSRSPYRKKRMFQKQAKINQKQTQFCKLKTGPILLRNILGPVFNI